VKTRDMAFGLVRWCGFLAGWLLLSTAVLAAEPPLNPPATNPVAAEPSATCELDLDGRHIARLVLQAEHGPRRELLRPGSSVSLPPGKYWIKQVELEGGYSASPRFVREKSFVLNPNEPCRPDIGAPLAPTIAMKRMGRLIKLDYQLLDAGGRNYVPDSNDRPPQFAVYQGDHQVSSGSFKYG
jgi:hypothetical protein